MPYCSYSSCPTTTSPYCHHQIRRARYSGSGYVSGYKVNSLTHNHEFLIDNNLILLAPSWHQCLISLLFYLSIKYPTKSRFMYKTKFIAASMTIMILGLILLNMENFWFYLDGYFKTTYSFDSSTNRTVNKTVYVTTACTASVQLSMASDFVNIFSRSFIPFIILTVLTGLLLYHVAKVRRNITDSTNTKKNGKSQVRFGRILIFLNILFLVLYLPWALSFIISYTITSRGVRLTSAGDSTDPNILYFYNISLCLSYCFNASPFFVNLAFNKLFKQEFLNLFCAYKMTSKFAFTRGITKSLT